MTGNWNNKQIRSLKHAIQLSLDHAKVTKNLSVDGVSDLLGLSSKFTLYKWASNQRVPLIMVRPLEFVTGEHFITRYLCHSSFHLMIKIPTGKGVTESSINNLQSAFAECIGILIGFYSRKVETNEAIASLDYMMEKLAWHRENINKFHQSEFDCQEYE